MDKRYQVFISSTYSDLKEERGKVMQTVMALDCIPAGMELFSAIDAEQLEFIKKIIDDCDYYILIIGGKYGSMTDEGISYTEEEYNYAVSKGIPVIAFLHDNINLLTGDKLDLDPNKRAKLEAFRDKVAKGRLVKFWNNADELNGQVAISLTKTIKTYPAVGWVRANLQTNAESLQEMNNLRKELAELKRKADRENKNIPDIAELDETITLTLQRVDFFNQHKPYKRTITWMELFDGISTQLMSPVIEFEMIKILSRVIWGKGKTNGYDYTISKEAFQQIKIQFLALGLISISNECWKLSSTGTKLMLRQHAIKTKKK